MYLNQADRGRDFVLRALAAAEIAEGCCDPTIRQSFMNLAEHWLDLAQLMLRPTPKAPAS
jgi:hypothetical protein